LLIKRLGKTSSNISEGNNEELNTKEVKVWQKEFYWPLAILWTWLKACSNMKCLDRRSGLQHPMFAYLSFGFLWLFFLS
jgi:hypothetical protein